MGGTGKINVPKELDREISRQRTSLELDFVSNSEWSVAVLDKNNDWWAEYNYNDGFFEVNYPRWSGSDFEIYTWPPEHPVDPLDDLEIIRPFVDPEQFMIYQSEILKSPNPSKYAADLTRRITNVYCDSDLNKKIRSH